MKLETVNVRPRNNKNNGVRPNPERKKDYDLVTFTKEFKRINSFSTVKIIYVPETHNKYIPQRIIYNTKNNRTTMIYHDNKVIRTQPSKCDLNNSTIELGVIIGLLKGFNMRDINAVIGYVWKNYRTTRQKEIYLRSLLHSLYFEAEVSVSQVDKIIKSLVDNKSKVIIGDYEILLEVK